MLQANFLTGSVNLILIRHGFGRVFVRAETPYIHQGADCNIHGSMRGIADAQGHHNDISHSVADRLGTVPAILVEARED